MAASWKTLRVFISSTFRDMHAERDHLVRFVFPKLREVLVKHRIHLIDVDLRWGVTSEQDSVAACREVIDECHPRFMGMLGGRYGWVPPESDQSITEDEVHYGVLERDAELWGNASFYFRDDTVTASIIEKMPGDFRELAGSENARKLVELKQSIVNARLPTFTYGAQWDANQERLTGLEAFGDHVFACLLKNIQDDPELYDHFASDAVGPVDEFSEEREAMEAFIEDRTERYVVGDRQALLDKMTAFAASNGEQNILVVEGEPGSGKSSLLGKLCRLLVAQGSPHILISHFVGASVGSTNLRRTLRRLCHEIAVAAGTSNPLPEDIRELIDLFGKLLNQVASRQRVILVIDAINQFDATDGAHFMAWLPLALPPNIRIIASSLEHTALASLRRRSEPVRIEKLESLSNEDAHGIIQAFLLRYSKRFSAEQITALLSKPEGRLPLYILTALQELRTLGTYEEITNRIRELPGEAKPLFAWILKQRLSNDPGFRNAEGQLCGSALVAKFASCLGVSRHGLSQEELIGLLDSGDPLGNVAALLRLLRPYLMHRGELIDFFHNQLREAVEDEYLNMGTQQHEAHQVLATYFHDIADPNREGRWKGTSVHALSELPFHQVRAQAWPELVATLENLFFLEAKVFHGMAFNLVEDFSVSVIHLRADHPQHRILELLAEALRRDIYFVNLHIYDYPQALFQSLWNSCWWYDCPEAAFHYQKPEGELEQPPPWESSQKDLKLSTLIEEWRTHRETRYPNFTWLRSMRPPPVPLGASQLAVFLGHEKRVSSVAFSPDGLLAVSGSGDNTVRLWDVERGRELVVFRGHKQPITSVAFSPDGRRVVSGSVDTTLRLWDAESGRELAVLLGHEDDVTSVTFSADGSRIFSASGDYSDNSQCNDNTLRIWDVESGRELAVLRGHEGPVTCVAASSNGKLISSGSYDQSVRIWDAESGCELAVLRGHASNVNSVAFSPDGQRLISGASDKTARLWEIKSGHELAIFSGHESPVYSVAFSPDGSNVLTGSHDHTIRLWNTENKHQLTILSGHEGRVSSVAFSPDGHRVLSGSLDQTLRLWKAEVGHAPFFLRGSKQEIACMDFSPDGRRIVSGSGRSINRNGDNTIRIWNAENGRELIVIRGHEGSVDHVAFSPDSKRILTGSGDSSVRLWDVESGSELAVLCGHESSIFYVAFSPDGRWGLSCSLDRTVRLWDLESGRELAVFRGHDSSIFNNVAFSPDQRRILSKSNDYTIRLWDVESGRELAVLRGHQGRFKPVAFSPDGRWLLSGSEDKAVRLWEAETGKELAVLRGHEFNVVVVAFSSNGRRIVSCDEKAEFLVWDFETLRRVQPMGRDLQALTDILNLDSEKWTASVENGETLIRSASHVQGEVRFPIALGRAHRSGIELKSYGRIWAGGGSISATAQLVLLRLEGGNVVGLEPFTAPQNKDILETKADAVSKEAAPNKLKPTEDNLRARGFRPTSSWYWERKMDDILGFDIICPECGSQDAYYPKDDLQPIKCASCSDDAAAVSTPDDKQLPAMSVLTCCRCGQSFTLSETGGCSYHPDAPENRGTAGPRMDYADLFYFSCCGKCVCESGEDSPPPISPGCVNGNHKAFAQDVDMMAATDPREERAEALPSEQAIDHAKSTEESFSARGFHPSHSWYWERKMDDTLGFDIICPKCGTEGAYFPKDDLQPTKCASCSDDAASVPTPDDKQLPTMSVLTCCRCGQSFTSSEAGGCSYHPKAPVSKDHCAGPEMDFAEIFVFPCCGEQVCEKGVDAPPRSSPGCITGDHKAFALDEGAVVGANRPEQKADASSFGQIIDQAVEIDFLANQSRLIRHHHYRFAQEEIPGFLWRNLDQSGYIFFEFTPDANGYDDSIPFLRDFALQSWDQVFYPSDEDYLPPAGLDVARRDLADGYRAAIIILPKPEVTCEAYMVAIVYRPVQGAEPFVLRYFTLEMGQSPQSPSGKTTFLCELGQDCSHRNLLEGSSPDVDSFCEALNQFLTRQAP